ncbi:MAG: ParB/RepB/Spo0J family partition protein [Oscillospiraceae bacterium]|nr:ParB/RepB/Spo0J family partition protein [Oscillospiraceae bacterium]
MPTEVKIIMIPTERIFHHKDNPRKELGDLTELSESIKAQGILQNLTVVPWGNVYPDEPEPIEGAYVTVIGHRRTAAAKAAGLKELPCVIADMDYKTQVSTMLLENLQRTDLSVPEQAQGFQMMMDLGSSVREISEKTGFAERTVQKRLQIAKLDKDKMRVAEQRGNVTLNDYIRIAALTNEKDRDNVLSYAGTASFNYMLSQAESKQKIAEHKKLVPGDMKELGIEKYDGEPESPYTSNKIDNVCSASLSAYDKDNLKIPNKKGLMWMIYQDWLYIVCKAKKKKQSEPKKSAKEIKADEAREQLKEKYLFMRELRRKFILDFSAHKKYKDVINKWLLYFVVWTNMSYTSKDDKLLEEVTGIKNTGGDRIGRDETLKWAMNSERAALIFAYYFAGDNTDRYYTLFTCDMNYGETMPTYKENKRLTKIYEMLEELGYSVSDEERKMLDGTHELFGGQNGA